MRSAARRDEVANYRMEMIIAAGEEESGAAGPEPEPAAVDVPAAPEDGGPRHWEVTGVSNALNLREQPSTSARTIGRHAPGNVTAADASSFRASQGQIAADMAPAIDRASRNR
jgi:hypothetical protein